VGAPGDLDLAPVVGTARELAAAIRNWRDGGRSPPLEVELGFEKSTLVGVLYDLYPKGQVLTQYARVKPKNELGAWVRHLALAAASGASLPTVLIGRPTEGDAPLLVRLFEPLSGDDAKRHLSKLLSFYRVGLMAPLSLFAKASRRFAELSIAGDASRDPLEAAKRTFLDDRKAPADADDSYVRRLFEGVDPFATAPVPFDDDGALGLPSFEELSRSVFGPLLASSRIVSP
jgi:exonuclease V gamma subunit